MMNIFLKHQYNFKRIVLTSDDFKKTNTLCTYFKYMIEITEKKNKKLENKISNEKVFNTFYKSIMYLWKWPFSEIWKEHEKNNKMKKEEEKKQK